MKGYKARLDLPLIKLVHEVRLKVWPLRTLSWPIRSSVRVGVMYSWPSFTYAFSSASVVISNCPFLDHAMSKRSRQICGSEKRHTRSHLDRFLGSRSGDRGYRIDLLRQDRAAEAWELTGKRDR